MMTFDPNSPTPPGRMRTTVTYLEMTAQPARRQRPVPLERLALMRAENCTFSFYRYLYDNVGQEWLWWFRRAMPEADLKAILSDPLVEIYVAYVAGVPAGFVELDRRQAGHCELAYLGLLPEFIGRGIGGWLLDWAVEAAWNGPGIEKIGVNTCTLDHPRALLTYQKAGFHPVRQQEKEEDDPRVTGLIPRHAAPHIPLIEPTAG